MANGFSDRKGFTLIEVLVSIVIMAVCLTVLMGLFSGGLRLKTQAKGYNRAVGFAWDKMEEILALNAITQGSETGEYQDGYKWESNISEYILEQEDKTLHPLNQMKKLYQVIVKISWPSVNKDKTYTIETIQLSENVNQ